MTAEERRRAMALAHTRTLVLAHARTKAEEAAAQAAYRDAARRWRTARDNLAKASESLIQAVTEENTDD